MENKLKASPLGVIETVTTLLPELLTEIRVMRKELNELRKEVLSRTNEDPMAKNKSKSANVASKYIGITRKKLDEYVSKGLITPYSSAKNKFHTSEVTVLRNKIRNNEL